MKLEKKPITQKKSKTNKSEKKNINQRVINFQLEG